MAGAQLWVGGSTPAWAALRARQHGGGQKDSPSEIRCPCAHPSLQPEEKQKAAQQFSKLQAAMKVLGVSPDEQKACWLILAAIYHLGAAGATKGNPPWSPAGWLVTRESWWAPGPPPVHPCPTQTCLLSETLLWLVPFPSPPRQSRSL